MALGIRKAMSHEWPENLILAILPNTYDCPEVLARDAGEKMELVVRQFCSPKKAGVVLARFRDKKPTERIAEEYDTTCGTVLTTFVRAMEDLRSNDCVLAMKTYVINEVQKPSDPMDWMVSELFFRTEGADKHVSRMDAYAKRAIERAGMKTIRDIYDFRKHKNVVFAQKTYEHVSNCLVALGLPPLDERDCVPWPRNFLTKVYGKEYEQKVLSEDSGDNLTWLLSMLLKESKVDMVLKIYRDHVSLLDFATEHGVTRQNVSDTISRVKAYLSEPRQRKLVEKYVLRGEKLPASAKKYTIAELFLYNHEEKDPTKERRLIDALEKKRIRTVSKLYSYLKDSETSLNLTSEQRNMLDERLVACGLPPVSGVQVSAYGATRQLPWPRMLLNRIFMTEGFSNCQLSENAGDVMEELLPLLLPPENSRVMIDRFKDKKRMRVISSENGENDGFSRVASVISSSIKYLITTSVTDLVRTTVVDGKPKSNGILGKKVSELFLRTDKTSKDIVVERKIMQALESAGGVTMVWQLYPHRGLNAFIPKMSKNSYSYLLHAIARNGLPLSLEINKKLLFDATLEEFFESAGESLEQNEEYANTCDALKAYFHEKGTADKPIVCALLSMTETQLAEVEGVGVRGAEIIASIAAEMFRPVTK